MSATNVSNSSEQENACVVCFKNVDLFSIGICDHPVCFECSTRMRVVCRQKECPICRQKLGEVIFTKDIEPYDTLKRKVESLNLRDRNYGISFHTPSIQRRYNHLLDHECFICKRNACSVPFKTFLLLKDHMRRIHNLYYCDLCVMNLKIFTFERKCYTRVELATHRRKGDLDNKSHRGHPRCEFCDTRFMDTDELFRHLRRDHLYCHFCDADGKHEYYSVYSDLRKHYFEEHYLCEEGDCKHEQFTSVFRSDIDLKAHIAAVHSRNLSKAATRQARTLELEFTLAPRTRTDTARGGRYYGSNRNAERQEEEGASGFDSYYLEPGGPGGTGGGLDETKRITELLAAENFPSLSGEPSAAVPRTISNVMITSKVNPLSEDNFPTLGSSNSASSRPAVTITSYNKFNSNSESRQPSVSITKGVPKLNSINYPALGESSTSASGSIKVNLNNNLQDRAKVKSPNVSIHVNHKTNGVTTHISQNSTATPTVSVRPNSVVEAFPALSSEPIPEAHWIPQKQKKQEPKASKVAPAPSLPSNSLSDFPSLAKSGKTDSKKSSSVNVPASSTWVNLNNFNSDVKINTKQKQEKNKDNKNVKNGKQESKNPKVEFSSDTKTKKKKNRSSAQEIEELTNSVTKNCNIDETDNKLMEDNKEQKNEITRKRSELNIESLEVREPLLFSSSSKDQPSISKPPPGFNVKPPPGFHNFPALQNTLSNDLTFTNSSGQSYSILPCPQFHPPPNFKGRNHILIEKMAMLKDSNEIQQFKMYSDMFRVGDIPAENYYEHCRNFMGSEFNNLFVELLVLLPNIGKQQELYKIHKSNTKTKLLEVCVTCSQVVLKNELRHHLSSHILDNHFPIIKQCHVNNVWNKK
ncbi:hypothetical protein FQA39_LY03155 [Lamprigera yunnana]|nr:hypothetical protein FQA39_LY03155 [Lamprigera yunnana]